MHEKRAKEILKDELPNVYVSLSSEVAPVLGEYERSATAMFNAYVGPVVEDYLENLVTELGNSGLKCQPLIAQANGGLATPAQTVPIFTVESGPAAGVVGSAYLANQLGVPNVIATDVGGTTFKVAVIEGGKWAYAKETVLNQYQLRLPMIVWFRLEPVVVQSPGWITGACASANRRVIRSRTGMLRLWRRPADGNGCRPRAGPHFGRQISRWQDGA